MVDKPQRNFVPMIRRCKLFLTLLEQALQAHYPLISCAELLLGDGNLFLQGVVLLDQLSLHMSKLFKIPLKKRHLLLLGTVI